MTDLERLLWFPVLIFSIIIHECAHGLAALRAGDPTAKDMGRITLNPLPHIDLFGSIILPVMLWFTGSPFLFAWAKPVPVNPNNFRDYRRDEIRVSFAGPASNLILSLLFLLIAIFCLTMFNTDYSIQRSTLLFSVFHIGMLLNLVPAFFNLLPTPPLDGSHILENMLPRQYAQYIARIRPYGIFILILFFMTPLFDIIWGPIFFIFNIYKNILQLF